MAAKKAPRATKKAAKTTKSAPTKKAKSAAKSAPTKKARSAAKSAPTKKATTKKAAKAPAKKPKPVAKAPKKTSAGRPTHPAILARTLLRSMVASSYYPPKQVAAGQALLLELAARIERERPVGEAVFALTHAMTEAFNDLQEAFYEAGSEIETVARDNIAEDVEFVLQTYGYDVDLEEAIGPRDW